MRSIIIAILFLLAGCKKAPERQGSMNSIAASELPGIVPGRPSNLTYSTELSKPTLTFNDSLVPKVNAPATVTRLSFEPLMKGQGNAPFNFMQGSTLYVPGKMPDEVFMFGWNFNAGGGPIILGQPGIGLSFEQHYKPVGQDLGLTEYHTFWITPQGKQVRLESYTINNAIGDIDHYNIHSRYYDKSPVDEHIYHGRWLGVNGDVLEAFSGPGWDYQWTYDSQGVQLTSVSGRPFYFRGPLYIEFPGGNIFHKKYVQFTTQVVFDGPTTFTGGVTFKGKVIFEQGFENLKP